MAPEPESVDETEVAKRHRQEKLKGISIFARARRKDAIFVAAQDAEREVASRREDGARLQAQQQGALDLEWSGLTRNDAETVMSVLAAAFEDNDAAAAPLGVSGDEATLVVIVPSAAAMPQKKPDITPTGRPTIKAVPKKEAADWHKIAAAGCILVTIREAFAVAPALKSVRIVAVTVPEPDAYGRVKPDVLIAAKFERPRLDGVQWATADSITILNGASSELVLTQVGVTKAMGPLSLHDEPELRAMLAAIDFGELGG